MTESRLLDRAGVPDRQVQEFRPLCESLEWQLADLHWAAAGLRPFVENQVPHLVTSSGRLSQQAAAVLYESCLESPPAGPGPLWVLELGAGTGLHARYFLDAFQDLCTAGGKDFYERLVYLCTDRSPRTVAQWAEHGLFEDHRGRVRCGTCDALHPDRVRTPDGQEIAVSGLRAVLCTYLLDTLPAAVLRRGGIRGDTVEELRLRTNLVADADTVRGYTPLGLEELRALSESPDPARRERLVPLLTLLEPELAFFPVDLSAVPHGAAALSLCPGQDLVLASHGAMACLEALLPLLGPAGFVLFNDYGPIKPEQVREMIAPQRLGATMALGVNLPLVEAHLARRGGRVLAPPGDDKWQIHARLVFPAHSPAAQPGTEAAFAAAFGAAAQEQVEVPLAEARQHLGAGRLDAALACYRAAVAASPPDFLVLGEAAEFAAAHLHDYSIGLELAQAAVRLNPWYASWLWNVLGDCHYCLGRLDEAHEAYLQAVRIHPQDARAHMNLSVTHGQRGELEAALLSIARGLTHDNQGLYRARLLDRQQQLLAVLSNRALGEQERALRRSDRLRSAVQP